MIPWYKQKTTLTAIGAVLSAIGGYLHGDINIVNLVTAVFGGLVVIFGRQAVEKSGPIQMQGMSNPETPTTLDTASEAVETKVYGR